MGGERLSTARQRFSGTICCECKILLPDDGWQGSERYCSACRPPGTYKVYLNFFRRGSDEAGGEWVVQFSPPSLDRAIGPLRVWKSSDVIRELIRRTPTKMALAAHQALDVAFETGRGAIFLNLTPEQYASLYIEFRGRPS
jgi:hypothetical protein